VNPVTWAISKIKEAGEWYEKTLDDNANLTWQMPLATVPTYWISWRLFKAGLNSAYRQVAEKTCGPVTDEQWRNFKTNYKPQVLPDAKLAAKHNVVSTIWHFAKDVWNLPHKFAHIFLYGLMEVEFLAAGFAAENGAGYLIGKTVDVNPALITPWVMFFGMSYAYYRRYYVFRHFGQAINAFGRPSEEFCRELAKYAPVPQPSPRTLTNAKEYAKRFFIEYAPSPEVVAKAGVTITFGALLAMIAESVAEAATSLGMFIIMPPGFEKHIKEIGKVSPTS